MNKYEIAALIQGIALTSLGLSTMGFLLAVNALFGAGVETFWLALSMALLFNAGLFGSLWGVRNIIASLDDKLGGNQMNNLVQARCRNKLNTANLCYFYETASGYLMPGQIHNLTKFGGKS